uniref:BICD family-like cargo adapter 1 n=1 Tax=Petromyzon marinus TaxID=7757 RepID=A0AAJ7SPW4_PETMA|nr:BICD family-like cargo adapter 1 [Petromyzon marinus]
MAETTAPPRRDEVVDAQYHHHHQQQQEDQKGDCSEQELLELLRQKDSELVMAAELGKALLESNQELRRTKEIQQAELGERMERLEQERHGAVRRLEVRESEWEGRVAELEVELAHVRQELDRKQQGSLETDREKSRALRELSEQNQRLLQQIVAAGETETRLSAELTKLREEFRERTRAAGVHALKETSLHSELRVLLERRRELECRVSALQEENAATQGELDEALARSAMLERQAHGAQVQLSQLQAERRETSDSPRCPARRRGSVSERDQGGDVNNMSLLSEIEHSMEREQFQQDIQSVYGQLQFLCEQLKGGDPRLKLDRKASGEVAAAGRAAPERWTGSDVAAWAESERWPASDAVDSGVETDVSVAESTGSEATPEGLHAAVDELKALIRNLCDSDLQLVREQNLQVQLRSAFSELETLRQERERDGEELRIYKEKAQCLQSELEAQAEELREAREECKGLHTVLAGLPWDDGLRKALRERDEAIAKKQGVEVELERCREDMVTLSNQLLEAIQQKVDLSQQLEAWQDDMQMVIGEQLKEQHRKDMARHVSAGSLRTKTVPQDTKGFFLSFLKNI